MVPATGASAALIGSNPHAHKQQSARTFLVINDTLLLDGVVCIAQIAPSQISLTSGRELQAMNA